LTRRWRNVSAWTAAVLVLLVLGLVGALWIGGNTAPGRRLIERLTSQLTGGTVTLVGLAGDFPAHLTLAHLTLTDRQGVWLSADHVSVDWSPLELLERRIRVERLQAALIRMARAPLGSGGSGSSPSIPHIEVAEFSVPVVELGAPLVGQATTLAVSGGLELRSLEEATAKVTAHRQNGAGDYVLHAVLDPRRFDATLDVHEPADGPLENLLSLPGLGALAATVVISGPRAAERVDATLDAGTLHAKVHGNVDLTHAAADLDYSLNAGELAPRPDVAFTAVALSGDWHGAWTAPQAQGQLRIDGLRLGDGTRMTQVSAQLAASAGALAVKARVDGLSLPGPAAKLLAADPVSIDARIALNETGRPVEVTATHPLFTLHAHGASAASSTGGRAATFELLLPTLTPLAALAGLDLAGNATLESEVTVGAHDTAATLTADLNVTGGTSAWARRLGLHPSLRGSVDFSESGITFDNLRLSANEATLKASGSATRVAGAASVSDSIRDIKVHWDLDAQQLGAWSPDLAGALQASGEISGAVKALQLDATASSQLSVRGSAPGGVQAIVHVRGLPLTPSGTVQAHGMVDGAPLDLDATLDRLGERDYRVMVRQAAWKSAHIEGDVTTDSKLNGSHGQLRLAVGTLTDFDRLVGSNLAGSVDGSLTFTPVGGRVQAQIELNASKLVVGTLAGNVHLSAAGPSNALALQLKADLPSLHGVPATAAAQASLDLDARELHIATFSLDYRNEKLETRGPVRVSFADGLAVDELKLGAGAAVFSLSGQLSPRMDLKASLLHVDPALVNVFIPQLLAGGKIDAHANLQGDPSSPTGSVELVATDLTFADDAATGLPPVNIRAKAELADDAANLTASLSAGTDSEAKASGTVPLNARGALDLKLGGKLDLGLANPLLEARGLRVAGALTLAATVTGSSADPIVGGDIVLTNGSARDYVHGVNLTDITADITGTEGGLEIKSFDAKAATGTVTLAGSFGLLQNGMPIDLTLTAKKAQAVSSSIITANLNSSLHLKGLLREQMTASGTIDINRAVIGIPDSLPPDIAVLDVRRRGQAATPAASSPRVVNLNIVIHAPREVLVQGRGLDAELAGDITITGTADQPDVSGGFNLVRGSFTISGNKLTLVQPGRVGFDGTGLKKKLDPTLEFTAQTSVTDDTITLTIGGLADAPQFTLTDSQGLPQDQIMSLLLFSQPAAQLSALQVAEVGAALATLTGVGGGGSNPLTRIQKTLGLDRLTVGANTTTTATGATQNSGAAIAAGRYVSKRVYVEAKQTTNGTSQVQVDVDLTKHLKLQTRLGNGTATTTQGTTPENDPGSSVGLSYQFEY